LLFLPLHQRWQHDVRIRVRGLGLSPAKTSQTRRLTLDLMQAGKSATQAVARVKTESPFIEFRQILAIDRNGVSAVHSGPNALGIWCSAAGTDVVSAGNLLANDTVPQAMVDAFEMAQGHLADRLLAGLIGGLEAGGEAGPIHSAGLQVCDAVNWPVVDLRCDWTQDCPISTLGTIWDVYKPQMESYVQRAIDPSAAPSYGVPGDE